MGTFSRDKEPTTDVVKSICLFKFPFLCYEATTLIFISPSKHEISDMRDYFGY